jgi:NhaA family Na+:H+ antiporter
MTVFFLLVGLEIEREIYIGELSTFKTALLPVVGAIGGSLLPPLIHYAFNRGLPTQAGAGIPMATDIAFAIGILALVGGKIPVSLKVFLTALAIIDDLFAIIVISFFYSSDISCVYLGGAFLLFMFLCVLNRWGVRVLWPYLCGGVLLWILIHNSGIHATITGVLLAFAIPFRGGDKSNSPSYRLQHALHKPVAFIIMPLFALANTGIVISYQLFGKLISGNGLGIILGLVVGKVVGISAAVLIFHKLRVVRIPSNWTVSHLVGVGFLGGIGFTMSIFISILAFGSNSPMSDSSKIAVFTGSLVSGICGYVILWSKGRKERDESKIVKLKV